MRHLLLVPLWVLYLLVVAATDNTLLVTLVTVCGGVCTAAITTIGGVMISRSNSQRPPPAADPSPSRDAATDAIVKARVAEALRAAGFAPKEPPS